MTATQSQIKDAKDALYLLYSAAVESEYRTYGDPDEHYAVVSAILQSALDTQKPAPETSKTIRDILNKEPRKYVTEEYKDWAIVHILEDGACLWDKLSKEDRSRPMMMYCPCKKCSPWSC